jgi:hypothetical protein
MLTFAHFFIFFLSMFYVYAIGLGQNIKKIPILSAAEKCRVSSIKNILYTVAVLFTAPVVNFAKCSLHHQQIRKICMLGKEENPCRTSSIQKGDDQKENPK